MSASTSVAVVFRTLQSIHDLRAVAGGASAATLARITAGIPMDQAEDRLRRAIFVDGCRLSGPGAQDLHLALVLAATLPDDDHDAFVLATAILLADRLQDGGGTDDLFWHWDAFHDHYRLIRAPARAAIMNGYARAHAEARVNLEDPPAGPDLHTDGFPEMMAAARALEDPDHRELLVAALSLGQTDPVARYWETLSAGTVNRPAAAVFPILRHVHESTRDWAPFGERMFDPDAPDVPVLPFPRD